MAIGASSVSLGHVPMEYRVDQLEQFLIGFTQGIR